MSSSDMRIIKDAKISRDPIVIARHNFDELDVTDLLAGDTATERPEGAQSGPDTLLPGDGVDSGLFPLRRDPSESLETAEARSQADMLLAAAAKEMARMKSQAVEEAASLKLQALEEGKQQGVEEARRQMAEQLRQTSDGCNAMMAAALQEARQVVVEAEHQIIELVLAISRKIIGDAMDARSDVIVSVVKSALERVRDQSQINIHVSLNDYEHILQARRELQGIVGAEQKLTVTADSVLPQGGCLIETSFGTVEAGVDTQLESIRKALQGILP